MGHLVVHKIPIHTQQEVCDPITCVLGGGVSNITAGRRHSVFFTHLFITIILQIKIENDLTRHGSLLSFHLVRGGEGVGEMGGILPQLSVVVLI